MNLPEWMNKQDIRNWHYGNIHERVSIEEIKDAKKYLMSLPIDVEDEDIPEWVDPEEFRLELEFQKLILHCIIEEIEHIFWIDWFDGSLKTNYATRLTNNNVIYKPSYLQGFSFWVPPTKIMDMSIFDLFDIFRPWKWRTIVYDRTFLNRALIQLIMKYCKPEQGVEFYEDLIPYVTEKLLDSGALVNMSFNFLDTQNQIINLLNRKSDIRKWYRIGEVDKAAIDNRPLQIEQLTKIKEQFEQITHPNFNFNIISTNNKSTGLKNTMKHALQNVDYLRKSEGIDFTPDPAPELKI